MRSLCLLLSISLAGCTSATTERHCVLGNSGSACLYVVTAKHPLSGNLVGGAWQFDDGHWEAAEITTEPSIIGAVTGALGSAAP